MMRLTYRYLSDAFEKAVETAYKAVMKPKEGTILTVAKGMADKAAELSERRQTICMISARKSSKRAIMF